MGDLGSDSGQSALSLSAKVVEALLKLLDKLYEAWANRGKAKLTKEQIEVAKAQNAELKDNAERKQALENLNGKTGYVNYQDLKKSGMPLKTFGIFMSEDEMKSFSELCKREGVLFSGVTDKDAIKDRDGVKTFELIVKESDLEKVRDVVDRMNTEKLIAEIDTKMEEIKAKGDNMTEQDKVDLIYLQAQKEELQRGSCRELNGQMAENIVDRAVSGEVQEPLTLDEALNRFTGRGIDKDVIAIVADANDPSKYIKCHGYQDTYNDKPYIKTEYEVYRGDDMVLKTHDGRFDGRPVNYWNDQKAAIQEAGEFSGTFFKFYTLDEYKAWAQEVRTQNEQELSSMEQSGDKDYSSIITDLEKQLDSKGGKMQDGVVVDKQTGEPITLSDDMSEEQRANVAEMTVIGKQINNYTELQNLETELAVARTEVEVSDEGTPERTEAEQALAEAQSRYDSAVELESQLLNERKDINGLQSKQIVENQVAELKYLPEDKAKIDALETEIDNKVYAMARSLKDADAKDLDGMKAELTSMKDELAKLKAEAVVNAQNAANAEKQDERREERVAEKDDKQMTMEEVKGAIRSERANEGANTHDNTAVKQHTQEQGAKAAVTHTGKTHTDR